MENVFKKKLSLSSLWLIVAIFLCIPSCAKAERYSDAELDTLVSTIALYPDPLLVHVLTASTHKEDIPSASSWANAHKHLKGESLTAEMQEDDLDYDPSVLALIPFPTVLATMAKYFTWTTQLGEAVTNQNKDVMDAVQRLRRSAYKHGHLRTDEQVTVNKGTVITIEPVRTQYIYVPVYNPSVVYYVYADRYVPMHYGYGVWTGHWYNEWAWNDCWFEWHSHSIRHHPRPPRHYSSRPRNTRRLPAHSGATLQPVVNGHPGVPSRSISQQDPRRYDQNVPIVRDHSANKINAKNDDRKRSQEKHGNVSVSRGKSSNYDDRKKYDQRIDNNGGLRRNTRR